MNGPGFRIESLSKVYPGGRGSAALVDATLELPPCSRTALVGRTGSGKTTLALCLAGMMEPSGGKIWRDNALSWPGRWGPRRSVQLVRQDSPLALNPAWAVRELVAEPLRFQRRDSHFGIEEETLQLARSVGLSEDCLRRRAEQLSGGQRQRVAVARALAVRDLELLILDEPLRGLDPASVEAMVALLLMIHEARRFSLLYITHDLECVRRIAGRVAVLSQGSVVETADVGEFFAEPRHPESRALVEAGR